LMYFIILILFLLFPLAFLSLMTLSFGGGIAVFVLNFLIGAVIGGIVLVWRLLVTLWYVPLTMYRLING
ncbi:MAG: hypothetical protein K2H01_10150, partial [Ruminococcus sp.]|nr:hypothetical protein [Ruminococcus sp.]